MFLTFFSLINGINFASIKEVSFSETGTLDYSVQLKENDYFQETYLPSGRQYIAGLIKYVDVMFNYSFKGNNDFDYMHSYSITATLIAHEKDKPDQILYEKDYVLKDKQAFDNKNPFVINENIRIDYDYYNQIINNFKSDYALSLDSYLKVSLNIDWNVQDEVFEKRVGKSDSLDLKIPLSQQTIKVAMDTDGLNKSTIVQSEPRIELMNTIYLILFWVFVGCDIFTTLAIVRLYVSERKRKGKFNLELEKIQRQYDRAIVETNILPMFDESNIIDVKTFEELLDARENVEKPILHKRDADMSTFVIVDNDLLYRYILRKSDFEN